MRKLILISISIIYSLTIMAQQNKVLFDKTKQGVRVQMIVNENDRLEEFKTLMTKDEKTIILDENVSIARFSINRNKFHFLKLFDFLIRDNQVFIFYNDFGRVFMDRYIVDKENVQSKNRYYIGSHMMISYENGGDIKSEVQVIWIQNKLYFFINAKQMYGGYLNGLFVFNNEEVQQISFTEKKQLIVLKPIIIGKGGKDWYDNNKDIEYKSEEDASRYDLLSRYYDIQSGYYKMTTNNEIYKKERTKLRNSGLENDKPIEINPSKEFELNNAQKDKITNTIRFILSEYDNIETSNIDLLGYIFSHTRLKHNSNEDLSRNENFNYSLDGDLFYFFVRTNSSQLKIVRYNMSTNDWLISDFETDKIELPK